MKFKIYFRITILFIFVVALINFVVLGQLGIIHYFEIKKEISSEKNKYSKLEKKIEKLNKKIECWKKDDFELEKMARQDLQMGFANEKVYILPVK